MKDAVTSDIYGYTVFANIDDRKGTIKGYQVILSKEQLEQIEAIVLSNKVRVVEEHTYEVVER